jgi:hypothetical protein
MASQSHPLLNFLVFYIVFSQLRRFVSSSVYRIMVSLPEIPVPL